MHIKKNSFFGFTKDPSRDEASVKNIVVVEDDTNTGDLVRLNLEGAGLKVHWAKDGLEGLDLIRKHLPAAVVLDIKVPKMNGYEVCASMQSDEQLSRIPIMIITGLVDDMPGEEESWRKKMNVAAFMCKPFEPSKFTERILQLVEG